MNVIFDWLCTLVSTQLSNYLSTLLSSSDVTQYYIQNSKVQLLEDIVTAYGIYGQQLSGTFDGFFQYLANTVQTGNVEELPHEFHQVKG